MTGSLMAVIRMSLPTCGGNGLLQFGCEVTTCGRSKTAVGETQTASGRRRRAPLLSATSVLTATADFHHLGFFSVLAIFTTVFAVFLGRTITGAMGAFARIVISHRSDLLTVSVERIILFKGGS